MIEVEKTSAEIREGRKKVDYSLAESTGNDHYLSYCQRRRCPGRHCCSLGCVNLGHASQHLHTLCHHSQPGNCQARKYGFNGKSVTKNVSEFSKGKQGF
jgi:hypothetical protein